MCINSYNFLLIEDLQRISSESGEHPGRWIRKFIDNFLNFVGNLIRYNYDAQFRTELVDFNVDLHGTTSLAFSV